MFQYINSIVAPFDCFIKLNIKSSFLHPSLWRLHFSCSDVQQKLDIMRSVVLMFDNLVLGGSLSLYKKLKKSVAKFKTRRGDPSGAISILQNDQLFNFLEMAIKHELYVYNVTLKKQRVNVNKNNSIAASFPDIKYLLYFKNSLIHTLSYTLGFDISITTKLPNVYILDAESLIPVFLSSFTIYVDAKKS